MKLGFDLDGVLCDYDEAFMHLISKLPDEEQRTAQLIYFTERKPLLDPELFCGEDDEYYVITGRHQGLKTVTEEWCRKFVPNAEDIYVVGSEPWFDLPESARDPLFSLRQKREKILELRIEVYVEDAPRNVRWLREELPEVRILQFGGRILRRKLVV